MNEQQFFPCSDFRSTANLFPENGNNIQVNDESDKQIKKCYDTVNPRLLAQFFLLGLTQGYYAAFTPLETQNTFNLTYSSLVHVNRKDYCEVIELITFLMWITQTKNAAQAVCSQASNFLGAIAGMMTFHFIAKPLYEFQNHLVEFYTSTDSNSTLI